MKNSIILILLICLATLKTNAGHNERSAKKCRWYAAKYKAEAHAGQFVSYNRRVEKGCDGRPPDYSAVADYDGQCAMANSYAGVSGASGSFIINCRKRGYWAGYIPELGRALGIDSPNEDEFDEIPSDNPYIQHSVAYVPEYIESNGRRYLKLSNITAKLSMDIKVTDRQNSLRLVVHDMDTTLLHDTAYEEIIYDKEILFQTELQLSDKGFEIINTNRDVSKRVLYKGKAEKGIFEESDFKYEIIDGVAYLTYIGPDEKIIDLTEYYTTDASWDNSELAFSSMGDCKPDFEKIISGKISSIETSPNVSISPNPVSGNVVSVNCNTTEYANVSIYDMQGRTLNVKVNKGSDKFTVDLTKLPRGTYYVLLKNNTQIILRKFVRL